MGSKTLQCCLRQRTRVSSMCRQSAMHKPSGFAPSCKAGTVPYAKVQGKQPS